MQLLREGAAQLAEAGVNSPEFDVRALLAWVLGAELNEIPLLCNRPVSADQLPGFRECLRRRCSREPLQYITGETEFYGQRFSCDRRAMVPRPETELLVEAVTAYCQQRGPQVTIADIGTGSGVVAVNLAVLLPEATVYATDISSDALELAAQNAAAHGVAERIRFLAGPYLQPLHEAGVSAQVEIVVTNPPYVATDVIEDLQPEIRDFEPREALDGGPQGLAFYSVFLPDCRRLPSLRLLAAEIGIGQAPAVTEMISDHLPVHKLNVLPDLAGIPRVVVAEL